MTVQADGKTVFTSDEALDLAFVPEYVAIVGSGYIGLEFSDVYTALGAEVTFIEVRTSKHAASSVPFFAASKGALVCDHRPRPVFWAGDISVAVHTKNPPSTIYCMVINISTTRRCCCWVSAILITCRGFGGRGLSVAESVLYVLKEKRPVLFFIFLPTALAVHPVSSTVPCTLSLPCGSSDIPEGRLAKQYLYLVLLRCGAVDPVGQHRQRLIDSFSKKQSSSAP